MGLLNNFKYFAILAFLLFAVIPVQAHVNPRNTGKSTTEPKVSEEQLPVQQQDQNTEKEEAVENDEAEDATGTNNSNSSLNYFFYMIIKVKFENLFKFPDHSGPQKSTGINLMNIKELDNYLNHSRI